jgi:dipeptidyl aminopeptidase/acylaminoacyl peptidase
MFWPHLKLRVSLICLCALNALAFRSVVASNLKTISPADIIDIQKVSDPQISPDGKHVAYVVELPEKSGEQKNAHIWLVSAGRKGSQCSFVMSARSDTSPRWSPDGRTLAFLSDRLNPLAHTSNSGFTFQILGAEGRPDLGSWAMTEEARKAQEDTRKNNQQIWIVSLTGGEAYPLTDIPGGVKSFKWSQDGRFIAFVRTDGDSKEETERKKRKADQILVDRDYHFARLWIYDLAAKTARLVTKADINIDDFDLSPNDTQAIARVSPTPRLNDYWYVSKIVVIDLASGQISRTLTENGAPEAVRWLRGGDKVLYAENTERQIASTPVVEALSSGTKTKFPSNYKATIRIARWNPDGSSLTVEGVEGTKPFFATWSVPSGAVHKLADVTADGYEFTQSDDGKIIAYLGQKTDQPNEIWTYGKEGTPQCLSDHNPQVSSWNLGKVQEITWNSSKDGRKIYGVLVLPPDYRPGTFYKTIIHAHGGPFEAWQMGWLGTWYEWAQLLASHGYVVLAPNPRGSEGQGIAFQEANFEDWGGGDFQDVMDGVDLLVKEKIADPSRLGVGGWSYGGFMTSWTITHTDRFKAAVVGAAVTDLYGMSTTTDIAPNFLNEFFGNFARNRRLYDDHSPMRWIENCHTPSLVLHGDSDERVPPFQGEEFYKALQLLGIESQLIRYPREPHIFGEREHEIDSLQRIIGWFDSHIQ